MPESVEQGWCDQLVQQRRRQHSTEDNQGERIKYLLASLSSPHDQWQQTNEAGCGRHHHWGQALQAPSDDHRFAELLPLVLHQVHVVRNHHDAIATDNPDQCDKTDPMGNR